jgi:hypothetical protein
MSIFDSILGSTGGKAPDIDNLASNVGISPEMAEQAIVALGLAHQGPGDTVQSAAQATGLDASIIGKIVTQIGGEESLGHFSQVTISNSQAGGLFGSLADRFFGKTGTHGSGGGRND